MEKNAIVINKEPSFNEVWREGYIEHNGEQYKFWLIHPEGVDPHGYEYECEVRWFFQRVPREVRAMYPYIIEAFKGAKAAPKTGLDDLETRRRGRSKF